jgi:Bacterial pre-peptidase C-terminal domain
MIRNYNVLGCSRDTSLKNEVSDFVGSPPTSSNKTRRTYWLLCLLMFMSAFVGQNSYAQTANSYGFATSTGATLDPMVGATVIGATANDDTPYAAANIGFTFLFEGAPFTQFSASPDGFIKLGGTTATSQFSNSINTTTNVPKIFPLWDDLATGSTAGGGGVKVLTTGVAGSQICMIQWFVTVPRSTAGAANSTFQVWLYETTNVIEFRYGTVGVAPSSSVGIGGATAANFHSVTLSASTSSTATVNNANAVAPASGRMYTFSPPGPCVGTPTAGSIPATLTGVCAGSTLTVTGQTSGATGITYTWQESDDDGVGDAWAAAVGGTGANTATYGTPGNLSVNRYYRCLVGCSSVGGGSAPTNSCFVSSLILCQYDVAYTTGAMTSIMPANGGSGLAYAGWGNTSGDDNRTLTQLLTSTTFKYQGVAVTGFQACTNGWMTFNTANTSSAFTNGLTLTTPIRVLAPFWEDLVMTGQNFANRDTCMRYQIVGTLGSGSAVIIIEWANMERFTIPGPNLNFQVILYELGNIIEYKYGTFEGFDGTVTAGYTYSIGYNGATPAGTTASDRFGMQTAVTNHFAASDPANHNVMPACSTKFVLTPGVYSGPVSAPIIPAPSNDNSGTAQTLTVNAAPCATYCNTYYTSRSATNSAFGTSTCSTAGFEDDDVWFQFNSSAANDYLIRLRSSPNYDGVIELYDSAFVLITCMNATGAGLIETINATDLIPDGETYYLRVFHNGATIGTSSGQFSICVSEVIPPPANDNIGGAITLTHSATCSPTNSLLPSTLVATASPQTVCGGNADDDVWYKFAFVFSEANIKVQSNGGYNAHVEAFVSDDDTATGVLTSVGCVNATGTGSIETLQILGGSPGQVIFVRVYHTLAGPGSGSFSICVTYPPVPVCVATPIAPLNAATVEACSAVTLSWAAVASASAYDVYLDTGAGPAVTLVSPDQTGTTYAAGLLTPATPYSWRVVPKNGTGSATGCSDFTFTTTAAVPPACIAAPTYPANGGSVCPDSSVLFTWPSSGVGVTYDVYIDAIQVATAQTGTTFTQTMGAGAHTWSVVPSNCVGTATGCADFTFTGDATTPVGDTLGTAIELGSIAGSSTVNGQIFISECWNNDNTASAGRDTYYRVELTCAGTIDLSTCTSGFDTLIYLLDSTGTFIDSDDDSCVTPNGLGSSLSVPGLAAGIYYIVVDGFGATSQGTYTLEIVTTPDAPCSSTVNLKAYIQGYYDDVNNQMVAAKFNQAVPGATNEVTTLTVELLNQNTLVSEHSTTAELLQDGTATCVFNDAPVGSFFLKVTTWNTIQTYSKLPISVGPSPVNYDFSDAATKAAGDNQKFLETGVYGIYSGNFIINLVQDPNIDNEDYSTWEADYNDGLFNYLATDLNGDANPDNADYSIWEGNYNDGIYEILPDPIP